MRLSYTFFIGLSGLTFCKTTFSFSNTSTTKVQSVQIPEKGAGPIDLAIVQKKSSLGVFSARSPSQTRTGTGTSSKNGLSDDALTDIDDDFSEWSLEEKIGQLFLVGYRSLDQIKKIRPGGVVLFSWNVKTVEDARQVTEQLGSFAQKNLRAPLFIAMDHEGGQVLRVRNGLTHFPDAGAVGATGRPELAYRVGKAMGHELRAIGVNMNLAPVLDIGNARSFLLNRVWGPGAIRVGQMASSFIRGLQSARVMSVAKHFPGHGRSVVDSHYKLPLLNESQDVLWKQDLEPFRQAVNEGVDAVMTAHVLIPSVDKMPASLSSQFIQGILRREIGFNGLVLTDDLEMGGVSEWGDPGDVAVKALRAGSDMILIVWSEEAQLKIVSRIKSAIKRGEITMADLDSKLERILAAKRHYLSTENNHRENPYWRQLLRSPETLRLARQISNEALIWKAGDFQGLMETFKKTQHETWKIWVPSRAARAVWKKFRPGDEVSILPVGTRLRDLREMKRSLAQNFSAGSKTIIITGPRIHSSEPIFQAIRHLLSSVQKGAYPKAHTIWAHQGQVPVRLTAQTQSFQRTGLIALHSTSVWGVAALVNLFRRSLVGNSTVTKWSSLEDIVALGQPSL